MGYHSLLSIFCLHSEWNDVIVINLLAEYNNVIIRGAWLHTNTRGCNGVEMITVCEFFVCVCVCA